MFHDNGLLSNWTVNNDNRESQTWKHESLYWITIKVCMAALIAKLPKCLPGKQLDISICHLHCDNLACISHYCNSHGQRWSVQSWHLHSWPRNLNVTRAASNKTLAVAGKRWTLSPITCLSALNSPTRAHFHRWSAANVNTSMDACDWRLPRGSSLH